MRSESKFYRTVFAGFLLLCFAHAQSAPTKQSEARLFGFEAGMSREQIVLLVGSGSVDTKNSKGDTLWLNAAPRPSTAVAKYVLVISPSRGLVKLITTSDALQADSEGSKLRVAFDTAASALSKEYGTPTQQIDSCTEWPGICERLLASLLLAGERRLANHWNLEEPIDSVYTVHVEAIGKDIASGWVVTLYELNGFHQYENEKASKRATEN
jgi:hypothetical protein